MQELTIFLRKFQSLIKQKCYEITRANFLCILIISKTFHLQIRRNKRTMNRFRVIDVFFYRIGISRVVTAAIKMMCQNRTKSWGNHSHPQVAVYHPSPRTRTHIAGLSSPTSVKTSNCQRWTGCSCAGLGTTAKFRRYKLWMSSNLKWLHLRLPTYQGPVSLSERNVTCT